LRNHAAHHNQAKQLQKSKISISSQASAEGDPSWVFTHDKANVFTSTCFAETSQLSPIIMIVTVLAELRGRGDLGEVGTWAQSFVAWNVLKFS